MVIINRAKQNFNTKRPNENEIKLSGLNLKMLERLGYFIQGGSVKE